MEEQVDSNVEKILKILCKVLISEVTTEIAQHDDKVFGTSIQYGEHQMTDITTPDLRE